MLHFTQSQKNKKIFIKYIKSNFNLKINELKGKYYHSFRVAKICEKLCEKLKLDKDLGCTIGILHDFYRFQQFTEFCSFCDYKTYDHGDKACELLFQKKFIKNFCIKNSQYAIIFFTVKNHNKHKINTAEIKSFFEGKEIQNLGEVVDLKKSENKYSKEQIINYCKLIRDADKIDIIKSLKNFKIFKSKNLKNGVTNSILNALNTKKLPKIKFCKTKLDRLLIYLGFIFDINFKESFLLIDFKKCFMKLQKKYNKFLIPKDREVLQVVVSNIIKM